MPILQNAKKALRVAKRRTTINNRVRSRFKTMLDAFKANPGDQTLAAAYSAVDKAAKKNLIHANKAARLKSQLAAQLTK